MLVKKKKINKIQVAVAYIEGVRPLAQCAAVPNGISSKYNDGVKHNYSDVFVLIDNTIGIINIVVTSKIRYLKNHFLKKKNILKNNHIIIQY